MSKEDAEVVWTLCKDKLPPRGVWVIVIEYGSQCERFRKRCWFGMKWNCSIGIERMYPNDKWRRI